MCFPSACVPCITGSHCCGHVFGACVCKLPEYDSCCTHVSDPVCESANLACKGLRATAQAAFSAAETAVKGAESSLDVANAGLVAAHGAVTAAKSSLDAAKETLSATAATYKLGSEAADKIAQFGLNGLIHIREISFDVSLSEANGGSFSGSVSASFAGQAEVTVSLNINLRDITSMVKQLASHIGSGLSGLF